MTINERLTPLHKALFVRDQPGPGEVRRRASGPRFCGDAAAALRDRRGIKERVKAAMVHAGLLN